MQEDWVRKNATPMCATTSIIFDEVAFKAHRHDVPGGGGAVTAVQAATKAEGGGGAGRARQEDRGDVDGVVICYCTCLSLLEQNKKQRRSDCLIYPLI